MSARPAPAICKRCRGTRIVLDRIFPSRGGHEYHRYRCEDCGHYRSKHVTKTRRPDIVVENHGSVVILRGMTDAGYAWIEENVSSDGFQPFGFGARLAEPRYVAPIIEGAQAAGLEVR